MRLTKDRTEEIRQELSKLHQTLKMSVQQAIRIGQLLTEQKEFMGYGDFLPWLEKNFNMGQRTAYNYMNLFEHQCKIATVANLQEAYKQIETIEAQEKQSKQECDRNMIAQYRKTGIKPPGWSRSLDNIIKKDAENIRRQEERIEKEAQEREENKERRKESSKGIPTEALEKATADILAKTKERNTWKEKIRLSDGGKESAFLDAIIDYLETLPSDSRRIEACNNIIKICRNISINLQKVKE